LTVAAPAANFSARARHRPATSHVTWLAKRGKGDAFRNTIERRYLDNVKYAKTQRPLPAARDQQQRHDAAKVSNSHQVA
jgi:hypothetical protein